MRRSRQHQCGAAGFTLIELLVVVAVAVVLLTLAVPSFTDFIRMQRLKGVHAELLSDLQFARSEAVARNTFMRIHFKQNATRSCYVIYTSPDETRCDCLLGAGSTCAGNLVEVRTVDVPKSLAVKIDVPAGQDTAFAFDHVTGGIMQIPVDDPPSPYRQFIIESSIDTSRTLRATVASTGRPSTCAPGSLSVGAPAC